MYIQLPKIKGSSRRVALQDLVVGREMPVRHSIHVIDVHMIWIAYMIWTAYMICIALQDLVFGREMPVRLPMYDMYCAPAVATPMRVCSRWVFACMICMAPGVHAFCV